MDRDENFREEYERQIANLLNKSFPEPCDSSEVPCRWFLPHFAVQNPNKPIKVRLLFDAAATNQGTSLGKKLFNGPEQLNLLPSIVYSFQEQIIVTADILKMFPRIRIRKEDQPSQLFLWRRNYRRIEPIPTKITEDLYARIKNIDEIKQPRLTRLYKTRGVRSANLHLSDENRLLRLHCKPEFISECDLKSRPSGQHELAMRPPLVRYATVKTGSERVVIDTTKNRGSCLYKEKSIQEPVTVTREHCPVALMNNERPVNVVQQKCWIILQRSRRKKVAPKCSPSYGQRPKRSAEGQLHGNSCEAVDCRSDPCDPFACTGHYIKANESCIPTSTQCQIQKNTLEDYDMRRTNENLWRRVSSNNQEARRPNEQ